MLIGAVEPGGSPRSLKVLRPFSMQIQRRANPRIAVAHEGRMAVRVGRGEVWWHPKPIDLSRTGIGLAFRHTNVPDWTVGMVVWVDLVHRLDVVSVKALVVRKEGQNYGLAFVPVSGAQQYEVNVRMDRILHDLASPAVEAQHVA